LRGGEYIIITTGGVIAIGSSKNKRIIFQKKRLKKERNKGVGKESPRGDFIGEEDVKRKG